jgi:hypothetical protein
MKVNDSLSKIMNQSKMSRSDIIFILQALIEAQEPINAVRSFGGVIPKSTLHDHLDKLEDIGMVETFVTFDEAVGGTARFVNIVGADIFDEF